MDFVAECVTAQEFVEFKKEYPGELTFVGSSVDGEAFAIMEGKNDSYLAFVIDKHGNICPVASGVGRYVPLVDGEPA